MTKQVHTKITNEVKKLITKYKGWRYYKIVGAMEQSMGMPDIMLTHADFETVFLEVKINNDKLRPGQKRFCENCRNYYVLRYYTETQLYYIDKPVERQLYDDEPIDKTQLDAHLNSFLLHKLLDTFFEKLEEYKPKRVTC